MYYLLSNYKIVNADDFEKRDIYCDFNQDTEVINPTKEEIEEFNLELIQMRAYPLKDWFNEDCKFYIIDEEREDILDFICDGDLIKFGNSIKQVKRDYVRGLNFDYKGIKMVIAKSTLRNIIEGIYKENKNGDYVLSWKK